MTALQKQGSSSSIVFDETKLGSWLTTKSTKFSGPMDDACNRLSKMLKNLGKQREMKNENYFKVVRNKIILEIEAPGLEIKNLATLIKKKEVELSKLNNLSNDKMRILTKAELNSLKRSHDQKIKDFVSNQDKYASIIDEYLKLMKTYFENCLAVFDNSANISDSNKADERQDDSNKLKVASSEKPVLVTDAVGSKQMENKKIEESNNNYLRRKLKKIMPGVLLSVTKPFTPLYADELKCSLGEVLMFIDDVDSNWIECYNGKRFGILPRINVKISEKTESKIFSL